MNARFNMCLIIVISIMYSKIKIEIIPTKVKKNKNFKQNVSMHVYMQQKKRFY